MSLILDALNRAEQERKRQDQVPDIHTIHLAPAMPLGNPSRAKRRLLIIGSLLVLIIVGFGFWFFRAPVSGLPESQDQDIAPSLVVEPQQSVPSSAPPAELTSAQTAPAIPVQNESVSDSTTNNKADINNLYAAAEIKPEEATMPSPVTELYIEEEKPKESESVATPFPEVVPAPEPLPEAKSHRLDEFPNLPFFNDLPWTQKQQIPTISYSRHNYLPNAVSSVVINGATRGVGNLTPGEFIVEDIVADGVVLRYQNMVFKLPALSGWVNM
jgi:general secretion pathway protein B